MAAHDVSMLSEQTLHFLLGEFVWDPPELPEAAAKSAAVVGRRIRLLDCRHQLAFLVEYVDDEDILETRGAAAVVDAATESHADSERVFVG